MIGPLGGPGNGLHVITASCLGGIEHLIALLAVPCCVTVLLSQADMGVAHTISEGYFGTRVVILSSMNM